MTLELSLHIAGLLSIYIICCWFIIYEFKHVFKSGMPVELSWFVVFSPFVVLLNLFFVLYICLFGLERFDVLISRIFGRKRK